MTPQQKLDALSTAYTTKKVDDARGEIVIINDASPVAEDMRNIQKNLNYVTYSFELDYELMSQACDILSEVPLDKLEDADTVELTADRASVYTATRLSWLNISNQDDITEIMKEYDCDIATACAVWYEQMLQTACDLIRAWVLEDQ